MNTRKKGWSLIELLLIIVLFSLTVLFSLIEISYSSNSVHNKFLEKIIPYACGSISTILLMNRLKIKLFTHIENLIYLIPCLIIAINNMQWIPFLSGKMQFVYTNFLDFLLFSLYCISIGLFEELVFRGLLFTLIASIFPNNKKGFLLAFFISSLLFGLSHFFNGFSVSTLIQVGYSILTGGLFAFCLIKTKNILCCALIHSLYNFCGLLFGSQGLGSGVIIDLPTTISMLVTGIVVGILVLIKTLTYSKSEQDRLYNYLGVKNNIKK